MSKVTVPIPLRSDPPTAQPINSDLAQPGQVIEILKGSGFWLQTGEANPDQI